MRVRRVFVRFPEQHGSDASLLASQKELDGLNIKFNVKIFSQAGIPAQTSIEIYNLNRKDLEFLTTSAAVWLEKRSLIQLYAGYDDDVRLLFSGQILDAPPSGNPDVSLSIKGISDMKWMTENVQLSMEETTIYELLKKASDIMGYPLNLPEGMKADNEWLNTRIDNFSYTGTPMGLLSRIQAECGGFSLEEKTYVVSCYNNQIYVWDTIDRRNVPKLLISKKTGMVGYPHPTGVGVNVKMLLNPNIKCGDIVHLESERVPMCNGDYYVVAITHEGELRANSYYTTLECAYAKQFDGEIVNAE